MAASGHAHVVSGKVHENAHIAPSCGKSLEHAHFIPVNFKLALRCAFRTPQLRRVHSHGIQIQAEHKDFKPSALTRNGIIASAHTTAIISCWPNG